MIEVRELRFTVAVDIFSSEYDGEKPKDLAEAILLNDPEFLRIADARVTRASLKQPKEVEF